MSLCTTPSTVLLTYLHFRITQLYETVVPTIPQSDSTKSELMKRLRAQLDISTFDISTLSSVERELITICPDILVSQLYQNTRDRFLSTLPVEAPHRLEKLEKSSPPENNISNQRTNMLIVCNWLHEYYFFICTREKFISDNKQLFIIMLLILVVITVASSVICQTLIHDRTGIQYSLLIGMACSGYLGATISVVRRFRTVAESPVDGIDREDKLLKLEQGQKGIYLSLLLGTLSPFIIMLVLRILPDGQNTTLLGINLLPHFKDVVISTTATIADVYLYTQLTDASDIARILIISIFCGFAERLIPDVLDRLTNEAEKKYITPHS
ncbi:hypothetical protein D3C81_108950 [compost metagenome]